MNTPCREFSLSLPKLERNRSNRAREIDHAVHPTTLREERKSEEQGNLGR